MHIRNTQTGKIVNFYDIVNDKDIINILSQTGDKLEDLAFTNTKDLVLLGSCGRWYTPPWGKYTVEV